VESPQINSLELRKSLKIFSKRVIHRI
jgi:hypothetical protein